MSQPILLEAKIDASNISTISVNLKPPEGYYDFFRLDLIDQDQSTASSMAQNFTFDQIQSNPNELNIIFYDSTKLKLVPAHVYELWCTVTRGDLSSRMHMDKSFAIKPDPVASFNIYILSETDLAVVWPNNLTPAVNQAKSQVCVF